jgi:hypothetical protein
MGGGLAPALEYKKLLQSKEAKAMHRFNALDQSDANRYVIDDSQ